MLAGLKLVGALPLHTHEIQLKDALQPDCDAILVVLLMLKSVPSARPPALHRNAAMIQP